MRGWGRGRGRQLECLCLVSGGAKCHRRAATHFHGVRLACWGDAPRIDCGPVLLDPHASQNAPALAWFLIHCGAVGTSWIPTSIQLTVGSEGGDRDP